MGSIRRCSAERDGRSDPCSGTLEQTGCGSFGDGGGGTGPRSAERGGAPGPCFGDVGACPRGRFGDCGGSWTRVRGTQRLPGSAFRGRRLPRHHAPGTAPAGRIRVPLHATAARNEKQRTLERAVRTFRERGALRVRPTRRHTPTSHVQGGVRTPLAVCESDPWCASWTRGMQAEGRRREHRQLLS